MAEPFSPHELPFASVVIPTRNEERTIEACLRSVLAQDYPRERFEVLVVDGDSEDRTREIVERIGASADVPVRLLSNPSRSIPAALNVAIKVARGDFLVRVDGHSLPEPGYLRHCFSGNIVHDADLAGGGSRRPGREPWAGRSRQPLRRRSRWETRCRGGLLPARARSRQFPAGRTDLPR
jgi:succinoglycan biosynthesis protein ExoA